MTKYSKVYICNGNNGWLNPIELGIPQDFGFMYLNRRVIKDRYNSEFTPPNGHYFEFPEYIEKGISFNIKLSINKNDNICGITSYKVRDLGDGPRSTVLDVPYRKKDYEAIDELLDKVTENPAKPLFDKICSKLEAGYKLTDGFTFKRKTDTSLEFYNQESKKVSLKISNLLKNLCLAFKYIEILYSLEFLERNDFYFEKKLVSLYHAVFSLIDPKEIPNYSILKKEADRRKELQNLVNDYDNLLAACKNNDIAKAKKYIKAAKIVVADDEKADFPLLCSVKNNNFELTKLLLKNGAFSIQTAYQVSKKTPYKDYYNSNMNLGALSAIYVAAINRNLNLVKLIISHDGIKNYKYATDQSANFDMVMLFRIDSLLDYLIEKDDLEILNLIITNLIAESCIFSPKDSIIKYLWGKGEFDILQQIIATKTNGSYSPIEFPDIDNISIEQIRSFAEQTQLIINWPGSLITKAFHSNKSIYELMLKQSNNQYYSSIEHIAEYAAKSKDIELFKDLSKYKLADINNFESIIFEFANPKCIFTNDFVNCVCNNYQNFQSYQNSNLKALVKHLLSNFDFKNTSKMIETIPINFTKEVNEFFCRLGYKNVSYSIDELNKFLEKLLTILISKKAFYASDGVFSCPIESSLFSYGSFNLCCRMFDSYSDYYDFSCYNRYIEIAKTVVFERINNDELFEWIIREVVHKTKTEKELRNFFYLLLETYIEHYFNEKRVPFVVTLLTRKNKTILYKNSLERLGILVKKFKIIQLLKDKLTDLKDGIWQNEKLYLYFKKNYPEENELLRLLEPL